jgi:DNA-binding transcriptional regulator YdaS (Cro superfamily)
VRTRVSTDKTRNRSKTYFMGVEDAAKAILAVLTQPEPTAQQGGGQTCRHCGSDNLSWFTAQTIRSSVVQGRLTTNDVECLFFLGCNCCSETLRTVTADEVAQNIPLSSQQAAGEAEAVKIERAVYNALTRQALRPQDDRQHIANLAASIIMEIISATPQPTETQRIVAWLRECADENIKASLHCRSGRAGETMRRFAQRRRDDALAIERGEHLAGEGQ